MSSIQYNQLMDHPTFNFTPHQLIDEHKNFFPEALDATVQALGSCGKDYFTVAIIGCQNSGKSTLLNNLFGTDFKVLQGDMGHRTTRGVILGRDKSASLMIMDVEGNDSYETHLQGHDNYQRMVCSFALVGANILLVNIFEKQLGQHSGSQYQTLSTVMRICIDQFKQQSPKTILFCLRDSYTKEMGQGQLKRKLQQDVLKIWKNVWSGAKKTENMEKYQTNPERFFTLEVAFLREFDPDYRQQFDQDVRKLRDRFINPQNELYLFKKQNKQYNLPAQDISRLLSSIWQVLISNKELNLPNEKVQIANYRCQQISNIIKKQFDNDLDQHANEVRDYGVILENVNKQFRKATTSYNKQIVEKWESDLVERFKPKIRTIVNKLIEEKENLLHQQFEDKIHNVFFDPKESFKTEALKLKEMITEEQVSFFRELNYEILDRKERIEKLSAVLQDLAQKQQVSKVKESNQKFQHQGQREMKVLSVKNMRQHFNFQFWDQLIVKFIAEKQKLSSVLDSQLLWARGNGASSNQLDATDQKLAEWLKFELKKQFQTDLPEKLISYFKKNFEYDQHNVRYDYNLLSDMKAIQIYTEAKQMTITLLKKLNNFTLTLSKRSSFIDVDDIELEGQMKPFLETNVILNILDVFERRAADEYAGVVRKRNEALMKKVPSYLYLIILFFIYDDLWFTAEEYPILHYSLVMLAVLVMLPYALGQGAVINQAFNLIAAKAGDLTDKAKSKLKNLRSQKEIPQQTK